MARIRMLQYELFSFIEMNAFEVEGHAVCPSLRDRKLPRFGSGSELHTQVAAVERHNACSTPHPASFFL